MLSENLIKYTQALIGAHNKTPCLLNYLLNTLKQASPLFLDNQAVKSNQTQFIPKSDKRKTEVLKMKKQEKILEIIKEFINEFESSSLPNGSSIKNYLLFLLTVFKILKKLKAGHERGLILAYVLSRLSQMLARYPLNYKNRAFRDPLALLFLVTEFAVQSAYNLKTPYKFEETILSQFTPLMTRYCLDSENPLEELVKEISEMPKFRINVKIGEDHRNVIKSILQYCIPSIPLKTRIQSATRLLARITREANDSVVLFHYNTLKLFFEKDNQIRFPLSKMAKEDMTKTKHRRFVNNILEELSGLASMT